ncbi:flagellar export protein FliJ [Methylibium rhizosphaerae]|jgi:flagellar FliJ protein|uniref:flagellar export protein FliJ n=1 Tax=Methylibium rhizosphaerae TaxID=2570323 RepID=UPI001126FFA8|nr:flagellar export protein FliJ [Methylibium rhizosphaerae]
MTSSTQAIHALVLVLEQTERERDQALAEQLRAQQVLDGAQRQAEQLLHYRSEYEQRWNTQFRQAGAKEIVQCYQGFMGRLQFAVDQQQHQVAMATATLAAARDTLRALELRTAAVRKLIERRQQELALAAGRREQKLTDEQASRAAWTRLSSLSNQPLPGGILPA